MMRDRFGLGNVYLKTGKYSLAEYHFRRALDINRANTTLVCCVGTVLEKLHRWKEAYEMYDRAAVLAPESPLVRFKRVRLLVKLQHFEVRSPSLSLCARIYRHLLKRFLTGSAPHRPPRATSSPYSTRLRSSQMCTSCWDSYTRPRASAPTCSVTLPRRRISSRGWQGASHPLVAPWAVLTLVRALQPYPPGH